MKQKWINRANLIGCLALLAGFVTQIELFFYLGVLSFLAGVVMAIVKEDEI